MNDGKRRNPIFEAILTTLRVAFVRKNKSMILFWKVVPRGGLINEFVSFLRHQLTENFKNTYRLPPRLTQSQKDLSYSLSRTSHAKPGYRVSCKVYPHEGDRDSRFKPDTNTQFSKLHLPRSSCHPLSD
jgi:hypothetical protein